MSHGARHETVAEILAPSSIADGLLRSTRGDDCIPRLAKISNAIEFAYHLLSQYPILTEPSIIW